METAKICIELPSSKYLVGSILTTVGAASLFFLYYKFKLLIPKEEKKTVRFTDSSYIEYDPNMEYGGWINELPTPYDPFHFTLIETNTVFIKLKNNILSIHNTDAEISKRAIWNEPTYFDVVFTSIRVYNLRGSKVVLLPLGLRHKKLWNKKYPICIRLNTSRMNLIEDLDEELIKTTCIEEHIYTDPLSAHFEKSVAIEETVSENSDTSVSHEESELDDEATTEKIIAEGVIEKLGEVEEFFQAKFNVNDWRPTQSLHEHKWTESPKIILFARVSREKEDWFRRLVIASHDINEENNDKIVDDKHVTKKKDKFVKVKQDIQIAEKENVPKNEPQNSIPVEINLKQDPLLLLKEKSYSCSKSTSLDNYIFPLTGNTSMCSFDSVACNFSEIELSSCNCEVNPVPSYRTVETQVDFNKTEEINKIEEINNIDRTSFASIEEEEYIQHMKRTQFILKHKTIYKFAVLHVPKTEESNLKFVGYQPNFEKPHEQTNNWLNMLLSRIFFDISKNELILNRIQNLIQKKLTSIKLPYFIENITLSDIKLSRTPPTIHHIYEPHVDERGLWIYIDASYEGNLTVAISTKIDLLQLKNQAGKQDVTISNRPPSVVLDTFDGLGATESSGHDIRKSKSRVSMMKKRFTASGKKFLLMIDKMASSKYVQRAASNKYMNRALEGVSSTEIKLALDVEYLEGTLAINIPPPPTDRLWFAFRDRPQLQVSARPAFGQKSINFTRIHKYIEAKVAEALQTFLVLPNMEDIILPILNPKIPK